MRLGFNRWGISVCLLFLEACANIVPPDGGDKDIHPPKLVAQSIKDSMLSAKPNQLSLQMDEYITVADAVKEITMSPSIEAPLLVNYTYKKILPSQPIPLLTAIFLYQIYRSPSCPYYLLLSTQNRI
jgi:hypothetical protein